MERNHLLSLFFVQTATRQISARSLRHERYRIAEQCDPGCHKETQSVPDRRLGAEGYLSGDQGCIKKWSMPIQNWRLAMSRFIIEFGARLSDHL